jgi:hypothetical protein
LDCRQGQSLPCRSNAFILTFALVLAGLAACKSATSGRFQVLTRLQSMSVESIWPMTSEVTAHCQTGEQLLGGGYSVIPGPYFSTQGSGARIGESTAVMVEASYPHESPPNALLDGWTVVAANPDEETLGPNWDTIVLSEAYCLATPDYPLSMSAVIQTYSIPAFADIGASYPELTQVQSAICPAGSTLTSGGFQVTNIEVDGFKPGVGAGQFQSASYLHNAFVTRSAPLIDGSGVATGWLVQLWPLNNAASFSNRVFALCAGRGLDPSSAASTTLSFPSPLPPQLTPTVGSSACANQEFSPGGGFQFPNDQIPGLNPADPYPDSAPFGSFFLTFQAIRSQSAGALSSWTVEGTSARDAGLGVGSSIVKIWAVCVKVPALLLQPTVRIEQPGEGASFPVAQGVTTTAPITFVAVAQDSASNPITDLRWDEITTGTPTLLGQGATIMAPLAGAYCDYSLHTVRVTATDSAGRQAMAIVNVGTGVPPSGSCHSPTP